MPELVEGGGLAFFGDSALCVAFMQKRYKAGKPELAKYVAACRKLLQKHRGLRVFWVHVPRSLNKWADYLCREAFAAEANVQLASLVPALPRVPALTDGVVVRVPGEGGDWQTFVGVVWDGNASTPRCCMRCSKVIEGEEPLWCHGCGGHAHRGCVKKQPLSRGPWHCGKCRGKFRRAGRRDVTLDVALLAYLVDAVLPGDAGE